MNSLLARSSANKFDCHQTKSHQVTICPNFALFAARSSSPVGSATPLAAAFDLVSLATIHYDVPGVDDWLSQYRVFRKPRQVAFDSAPKRRSSARIRKVHMHELKVRGSESTIGVGDRA